MKRPGLVLKEIFYDNIYYFRKQAPIRYAPGTWITIVINGVLPIIVEGRVSIDYSTHMTVTVYNLICNATWPGLKDAVYAEVSTNVRHKIICDNWAI